MLTSTKFFLEGSKIINKFPSYLCTSAALVQERLQTFRTTETDPLKHTKDHIGQFYTVNANDSKTLFSYGGLPKSFAINTHTFNEICLMIRRPSVDIINCINNLDFSKPAVRFVLYGEKGCGKSLTVAHLLHYAFKKHFLIFHVPWLGDWVRYPKEFSNSEVREGFIDQNLEVSHWLLHFKTQNASLLPDLKTTEDHVWSKRETTPRNSSLLDLVDHGINRIKYASEVLVALCQEVKNLSDGGGCKTLVCIDGFNALFYPNTRVFAPGKIPIPPSRITATIGLLNLTKFDWKNAVIVLTTDERVEAKTDQISHLPRYLLIYLTLILSYN